MSRSGQATYLDALAPGQLDADASTDFLDSGPEMTRFLAEQAHAVSSVRGFIAGRHAAQKG